ncbi:Putative FAD dependent oxidoreductase, FAD/NAD(P)-binding domain superfamily, MTOX family [Colletotrichum destructivum]|uniref:FAD dependent oxidoreductase, FAD/NAD(P)-binding domain superfamily, MTOX family n=1 Tax=Colletotrichum destructivum TaxID=34406 RepID=A0AAX4IH24_9PEZI|nr:Putative FAD dependent oxidoreductase, FAD/NAD(P)-binding domain superfamily, MTOX family [Colletotrichum destructivum]
MTISQSDPIIIVGAGAFGLSTAYHLSLAGYTNISVFDKHEQIPPRDSAANDINKIFRAEYEDSFYTNLTIKAAAAWQTPLFAPSFHRTGFLHCVSARAPERAAETLQRFQKASEDHPLLAKHVVPINGGKDINHNVWQYGEGPCSGWKGYLNRFDGYVHSGNALIALYNATRVRGVKFFLGQHGAVEEVVYQTSSEGRKATGIKTQAGHHVPSKLVIVAVGAAAARLVPECSRQVVAKSWSVAHVELTDEETSALRGIPVTYARDLGFYFEPDPKTNLLKLCPMGGGYINTDPKTGVSLPPAYEESQFMPLHDQQKVRQLLAETLPALKDRPLVKQTICWFADTADSEFVIDYVPESNGSVVLMSGDSGHAAKLIPLVGDWVKSLLEAPDNKQPVERWRWKEPKANGDGKWGDTVSWRLGSTVEFAEIRKARTSKL